MKSVPSLMIFLSLFTIASFGQKFSISEMINLCEKDENVFDSYVISKGYRYDGLIGENKSIVSYVSKKNKSNYVSMMHQDTPSRRKAISWMFSSNAEYIRLKKELSNKEFTSLPPRTTEHDIVFVYRKGNYLFELGPGVLCYQDRVYTLIIRRLYE